MEGSVSYKRLFRHPTNGKIFLPINIDGIETADNFITIPKLVTMGALGFLLMLIIMNAASGGINLFVGIVVWLVVAVYATRYIIFEEKRYYKAYMQTKKIEICTPAEFFKITAVRETPAGSIIMFGNGSVGILVKLERGTVVGRPSDFMGEHYDAMAEMFRHLLKTGLKFIILDVCESTGNESTVDALGRLTVNNSNKNINKLMELQVGFIKTLVNDTIYTKDYVLIYTDASRIGTLIGEAEEALRMSLDGAIDGYEFQDQNGISTFVSEYFGVGFFSGEDVLRSGVVRKAFKIIGIEYTDGVRLAIDDNARRIVEKQVKGVDEGKFTARQVSLRKALAVGSEDALGLEQDIGAANRGVMFETPVQGFGTPQNAFNPQQGQFPQQPAVGFPMAPQPSQGQPQQAPAFSQHPVQQTQSFPAQQPSQGFPVQQTQGFPQQNYPNGDKS